tara:strand:- start:116 stop:2083 length:1968 start_codon:yes stop_codon:yes gene_type:complete
VAGSNYEVNIKLNLKSVNKQLNNLEKRISRINKLAQGGRASRTVNKNEKEKLNQAVKVTRQEQRTLRIKQKQLKVDQAQLKVEKETAAAINRQVGGGSTGGGSTGGGSATKGGARPPARGGGGFGNAISSAAISGAFPLLFGQGPAAAAGGFSGGLIGTALGGQMGGFAGGLIGTTVVTAFQEQVLGLANALDPLNADIDTLIGKLGGLSSARKQEIKIIEQFNGKQAALQEITKDLADVIGEEGVAAFKKLRESAELFTDKFINLGLKLAAKAADIVNDTKEFFKPGGFDLAQAQAGLKSINDSTIDSLNKELENLRTELKELPKLNILETTTLGLIGNAKEKISDQADVTKEIEGVKDTIKLNAAKKAGLILDKEASAALNNKVLATNLELKEQERLNDIRKEGTFIISKGLGQELLALDKLNDDRVKIFETQKESAQAEVDKLLALEKLTPEQEKQLLLNQETVKSINGQINANNKNFKELRNSTLEARKLQNAANETVDAFEKLNITIQNDIKQGIKGLIKGTSTLGDLLNNVADRFLDLALNQALFGNAGGQTVTGGLFKMFGFADGGRPPVGRPSIVGERGPELFVPDRTGTIIPNKQLGGGTSIVVNVDASGSSIEGDESEGRELGRMISVAIQSELVKQKRPGGLLA